MKIIKSLLLISSLFAAFSLYAQSSIAELDNFNMMMDYYERNDFIDKREVLEADRLEIQQSSGLKITTITPLTRFFKIQFYTVLDGLGNGGITGTSVIYDNLNYLNAIYADADVQFILCNDPLIEIRDDYYYTHGHQVCGLNSAYGNTNAINVFYVDSMQGWAWASAGCCATVIRREVASNNTTLTHEIGHIFGLDHTFSDNPAMLELVTRGVSANCSYRADNFCDTAADPKVEKWEIDSTTCVYTGIRLDSLNVPYDPPIQNFMTYGHPHCRTEFSPSQISKISLTANVTRLQNRLSPITSIVDNSNLNYNVSGELVRLQNVTVNSGANISINACGWVKLESNIEFKVGSVVVIND